MKDKKTTSIIIAILSLLIASAMVYGAVKKSESDSEKYKGWKTYENKEAGFSLKYPASFVIYEDEIKKPKEYQYPKEIIFASRPRPERPGMNIETYVDRKGYAIVVDSWENQKSLTLEEWLRPNVLENIKKQKNHEIKVVGQRAFIAKRHAGELYTLDVDFVTKDKYFSIYLIPLILEKSFDKYPEYKNRYEDSVKNLYLMLESFKLIEKSK